MRYVRYIVLATIAIALISVSLANRGLVELKLVPEDLAGFLGIEWSITLPLFVIALGGVVAGLIIGFIWEWMREHKHRREASVKAREADRLAREVDKLKKDKHKEKDEVLALLE